MLSKKKIKVMFEMASYERSLGKKDLKIIQYYKNDFIRLNILKSFICITISYLLILGLVGVYYLEFIDRKSVV